MNEHHHVKQNRPDSEVGGHTRKLERRKGSQKNRKNRRGGRSGAGRREEEVKGKHWGKKLAKLCYVMYECHGESHLPGTIVMQ